MRPTIRRWAVYRRSPKHSESDWDDREAELLYRMLEEQVIPMFYDRNEKGIPAAWVARIRASMAGLTPRYSSSRMMREYVQNAYQPAAESYRRRKADGASLARELARWQERLDENWKSLRFGRLMVNKENESWHFKVEVYLGDVSPEDVHVELYADPLRGTEHGERQTADESHHGPNRSYCRCCKRILVLCKRICKSSCRGLYAQVVPYHPEAFVPKELLTSCGCVD
jgi:starch phosphorylase